MSTPASNDFPLSSIDPLREVTYTLDIDDVVALRMYLVLHGPQAMHRKKGRMWLPIIFGVVLGTVPLFLGPFQAGGWNPVMLVPLIAGLLVAGFMMFFATMMANPKNPLYKSSLEKATRQLVKRQQASGELDRQLGEQRLELTEQELRHSTSYDTSVIPWSALTEIGTTDDHAFFFRDAYSAVVLHAEAFESDREFAAFVATARNYHQAARRSDQQPAPTTEFGLSRRGSGVMEVVYKLTVDDGMAALRVVSLREMSPSVFGSRKHALFSLLGMVPLVIYLLTAGPGGGQMAVVALPFLLMGAVLLLFTLLPSNPLMNYIMRRHMAKLPYYNQSTHRMRLTPDTLILSADSVVKAIPWLTVQKIIATDEHAFFRVSQSEVVPLPKRAFGSEGEFSDFVETANKHHEAALMS